MRQHDFFDPLGHSGRDVVEVRGLALDDRSQADDRVVVTARSQLLGKERDVKRAWHLYHLNIFLTYAVTAQGVDRSGLQPFGDEAVELRNNQAKPHPGRVHLTANHPYHAASLTATASAR